MTIPIFFAIVGLVTWLVCARPGVSWLEAWLARVGMISFACGLGAYLFSVSGKPIW